MGFEDETKILKALEEAKGEIEIAIQNLIWTIFEIKFSRKLLKK